MVLCICLLLEKNIHYCFQYPVHTLKFQNSNKLTVNFPKRNLQIWQPCLDFISTFMSWWHPVYYIFSSDFLCCVLRRFVHLSLNLVSPTKLCRFCGFVGWITVIIKKNNNWVDIGHFSCYIWIMYRRQNQCDDGVLLRFKNPILSVAVSTCDLKGYMAVKSPTSPSPCPPSPSLPSRLQSPIRWKALLLWIFLCVRWNFEFMPCHL